MIILPEVLPRFHASKDRHMLHEAGIPWVCDTFDEHVEELYRSCTVSPAIHMLHQ
jgi:hypothetical protein